MTGRYLLMTRKKTKARKGIPTAAKNATRLEKADAAVAHAVAPYEDAPPIRALSTFSKLGDQPPMLTISGLVLGAGLVARNGRMVRAGARMVAAHLLATAAKNFIKRRVDRTRPNILVREGRYKMKRGDKRGKADTSFPSGHSAGALAVARAFAREYPEHRHAAHGAAAVIAVAQIPRCAHYPTDVLAGSAIGIASEALVAAALPVAKD